MFIRKAPRLDTWDYASPGLYFVTIVTQDRIHRFGYVRAGLRAGPAPHVVLSRAGEVIDFRLRQIELRFKDVSLDEYVIMPNHMHAIVRIHEHANAGPARRPAPTRVALPDVMYWFKSITTNDYRRGVLRGSFAPYNKRLWQRSYHDHIIRDDEDLNRIRQYILDNPAKWDEDEYR